MSTAVAMAGTGDWARSGLGPALRAIAGVAIVACASPDLPQAHRFAADMGIPRVYPGLEEMLAGQPGLDLLVVSTPDDHHPAAIRCAVAAGVAVFCEKPLANSAADADLLAEAVEQAGIPATVGFSFRYSDAVQQLRRELQAGLLGTPWLLELHEHNPQFHPAIGRPLTAGSVEGPGLLHELFQDRRVVAVHHPGAVALLQVPHPFPQTAFRSQHLRVASRRPVAVRGVLSPGPWPP